MVVVGSRRALLSAAVTTNLFSRDDSKSAASLGEIICKFTPRSFRLAVAASGRFLYRGENGIGRFKVLAPEPDLLIPGTYEDPSALAYFRCLEKRLSSSDTDAVPSKGHIATSDMSEASRWGEAVSVWPLGASLSYVWPRQSKVFFPSGMGCPNDELAVNHDMEMALTLGHEVLFSSRAVSDSGRNNLHGLLRNTRSKSAFLAVSSDYDNELMGLISQAMLL